MPPFNGQSDQEIMKKVRIGKFAFSDPCWANISDKGKDLISQLLTYEPDKRPSAANIAMGALTNLKTFRAD
jgi:calcium-dependent protein kinase